MKEAVDTAVKREMEIVKQRLNSEVTRLEGRLDKLKQSLEPTKNISYNFIIIAFPQEEGSPGVIVVTCKSKDDKENVMKNKYKLRHTHDFKNVYIEIEKNLERKTI